MKPATVETIRPPVTCACGHKIFDGLVIRSRVVRILANGSEAKCRCRHWVPLPVGYLG